MFIPFLFKFFNSKPLKQIPPTTKISLDGREQKTLAEPSGTAQEMYPTSVCQLINQLGLINIGITLVAKYFKIRNSYWE